MIAYAVLSSVCVEYSTVNPGSQEAKRYHELGQDFKRRLGASIFDLPLVMPATKDYIEALLAAVSSMRLLCTSVG